MPRSLPVSRGSWPLTNRLRWTQRAAEEYSALVRNTKRDWPANVDEIARAIYQRAESLLQVPYIGRIGNMSGTRELVVGSVPYVIVYEVQGQERSMDR